ncbi:hypothetical protein [Endozoicomonas sp.]|uniref:hypothetical protein n=1 Tax=Endozoicomonas sp. TaxID=1892382 RepID=UPI00383A6426
MNTDKAKLLVETGNITGAVITAAPLVAGKWVVQLHRVGGDVVPLTARRENIRQFASIDSAVKVLNELGCKTATVDWSGQQ